MVFIHVGLCPWCYTFGLDDVLSLHRYTTTVDELTSLDEAVDAGYCAAVDNKKSALTLPVCCIYVRKLMNSLG
jgi:hypothetical protein